MEKSLQTAALISSFANSIFMKYSSDCELSLKLSKLCAEEFLNDSFSLDISEAEYSEAIEEIKDYGLILNAIIAVRSEGRYPYFMEKAVAAGIILENKDKEINKKFVKEYTGLSENDVVYCITEKAEKIIANGLDEDIEKAKRIIDAYACGFYSELTYRGCGQCTIAALDKWTGTKHPEIFKAATGLSGGQALCGDGVCGAYIGGILYMGSYRGREFDQMLIDGDKENQYFAYECSQMLHDKLIACFGTAICRGLHLKMFDTGEFYTLRTKQRRNEFEAAGAHTVVCTSVVALFTSWIAEIMIEKGLA